MSRTREAGAADLFFALGDPTRLSVVSRLGGSGAQTATVLAEGAQVSRQAIVKHLQVLEGAGLVSHEKHGREVLYLLTPARLDDARAFLDQISLSWDHSLDRLRKLVERPARPKRSK
jgi:DNA-binding transcriptional ArsR family regulator